MSKNKKNTVGIEDILDTIAGKGRDPRIREVADVEAAIAMETRRLMERKGFTIQGLARRTHLSPTTIHRFFRLENVNLTTLLRILMELEVSREQMLDAVHSLIRSDKQEWKMDVTEKNGGVLDFITMAADRVQWRFRDKTIIPHDKGSWKQKAA